MAAPRPPAAPRAESAELELFLLKLSYTEGKLVNLEANTAFLLADPASAWVVYAGQVDVFAVPVRGGQVGGPRKLLFSAELGCALFGIEAAGAGIGLLVSGRPGTRLVQLPLSRLQALGTTLEYAALVAAHVATWIAGLSQSLVREIPPHAYVLLDAGQQIATPAQAIVLPRKDLLWVEHRAGASAYLGRLDVPAIGPGAPLPLVRQTWLQTTAPATLRALDSEAWLESDPMWSGLLRYQRLAGEILARNYALDARADQDQLQKKAAAQQAVVESVLHTSVGLLAPATTRPAIAPETSADALLQACQLVGQALGVTIRAPAGARSAAPAEALEQIVAASFTRIRRVTLRGAWWRHDSGPLLAFQESGSPVAVLPRGPGRYELLDPRDPRPVALTRGVAARLAPAAYMFYRPFPARRLTVWDLLRHGVRHSGRDLRTTVLLGLAMGLLGLLPPLATGLIFDRLIPNADQDLLLQVGAALLALAVTVALFQLARSSALLRAEGRMDAAVHAAVWDRLLNLPVPFFRDYSAGDLGARAMGISTIHQILSGTVLTTILSSLFSIVNLALLFYYQAGLALVATGLVLLSALVTLLTGYLQIRAQRARTAIAGQLAGLALQIINGIAKFRAAGAEAQAFALWADHFNRQQALDYKTSAFGNALAVFNAVYPLLTSMAIFGAIGATVPVRFSTGEFLAFQAAFGVLLYSSLQLSAAWLGVLSIVPIYERAKPILRTLPEVDAAKANPGALTGAIEVVHVSFSYKDNGPAVLTDVSLQIRPGEFVALVGASGSGKSTLFRLLLGFEAPQAGTIYYDGQDLAGLDLRAVRRQIGTVLQNGRLMAGDLFQNISGGAILTLDEAWEAVRLAGLEADIKALPMGMRTLVSEGGGTLSGGQRQRVLIARALVRRPRIVFFDEATSALDNLTQQIVSTSLADLQATRVVIAHRLSTIVNADRICVLDKGRVVQVGTYAQLIDQPGPFAELAKRQTL